MAYAKLCCPPQQKPMVAIVPRAAPGSVSTYAAVASRSPITRAGSSPANNLRAESGLGGVWPYLEPRRSGAMATYPCPASLSTTDVSQGVRPKIWWMTRMVGAESFRSGQAT